MLQSCAALGSSQKSYFAPNTNSNLQNILFVFTNVRKSGSACMANTEIMCWSRHPVQSSSASLFKGHPLQIRHKQDWGQGFILLLPQTAALPESDAGSGVIKPASSFVIQNRQTSCSMWCPMYRAPC